MKPKLLFHSQGKAVSALQSRLNELLPEKAPALTVDGVFGEKTHARVKDFQVKAGLVVDGVVGAKTWAALDGKAPPPPNTPKASAPAYEHKVKWTPVLDGAFTRCHFGTGASTLGVAPPGRPATVHDCRAHLNLRPFGMCQSMGNPTVAAVTVASITLSPQPCMPVPVSLWSPAQPQQLVEPGQVPAIGSGSVVMCAWGGLITVS